MAVGLQFLINMVSFRRAVTHWSARRQRRQARGKSSQTSLPSQFSKINAVEFPERERTRESIRQRERASFIARDVAMPFERARGWRGGGVFGWWMGLDGVSV